MFEIDIPGAIIKPYIRMTQHGKFVNAQAQEYIASKLTLSLQIKSAMNAAGKSMLAARTPLFVYVKIITPKSQGHRADLDNIFKAIMDACNGIVFPDDRWVDGFRVDRDFGSPGLKMRILKLEDKKGSQCHLPRRQARQQ